MQQKSYEEQLAEYEKNKERKHMACKGTGVTACCGKPQCHSCHGKGSRKCLPCNGTGLQFPNLVKPSPPGTQSAQSQPKPPPASAYQVAPSQRPKPQPPQQQPQQPPPQQSGGGGWGGGWGGGSGWGEPQQQAEHDRKEARNREIPELFNLKLRDEGVIKGSCSMFGLLLDGKHVAQTAVSWGNGCGWGDCSVTVWDAEEWLEKHKFPGVYSTSLGAFDYKNDTAAWVSNSDLWFSSVSGLSEKKHSLSFMQRMCSAALVPEAGGGSPTKVLVGGEDKLVVVDLETGQIAGGSKDFNGYEYPILMRSLPEQPNVVALQMRSGKVQLWDINSFGGSPLFEWQGGDRNNWNYPSLDIPRSNPNHILVAGSNVIKLFDFKAGKDSPFWEVATIPQEGIINAALHGNVIAAITGLFVSMYHTDSKEVVRKLRIDGNSAGQVVIDAERIVYSVPQGMWEAKYHDLPPVNLSREILPLAQHSWIPGPRSRTDIGRFALTTEEAVTAPVKLTTEFLLDGKLRSSRAIAVSDVEGTGSCVSVYDTDSWKELGHFQRNRSILFGGLDWFNDVAVWLTYESPVMKVGNTSTFQEHEHRYHSIHDFVCLHMAAIMRTNGDPTLVALGNDDHIVLSDIETGRFIHSLTDFGVPKPCFRMMRAVPGFNNVVAVMLDTGTVKVFDLNTGSNRPIKTCIGVESDRNTPPILNMPEANGGQFLVAGGSSAGIFDFRSGRDKPFWKVNKDTELRAHEDVVVDATCFANVVALWTNCNEPTVLLYDTTGANGGPTPRLHAYRTPGYPHKIVMDYDRIYCAMSGTGVLSGGVWTAQIPK